MNKADIFFLMFLVTAIGLIIAAGWIGHLYYMLDVLKADLKLKDELKQNTYDLSCSQTVDFCKEILKHIEPILFHAAAMKGFTEGQKEYYEKYLKGDKK